MRQFWRDLRCTLLLTLIATGGGALLLASCGPKPASAAEGPKKPAMSAPRVAVAGDTVRVRAPVRSTVPVDSIHVVIALPGSGKPFAHTMLRTVAANVTDTARITWIGVPAGSYSGTVTATSYRGSCVVVSDCRSPATTRAFAVTVQQGPPPPPVLDSVQVSAIRLFQARPLASRDLRTDESAMICTAYGFPGDVWAITDSAAIDCGGAFAVQFTAFQRAVSTAQQMEANTWTTEWDSVALRVGS